MKSKLHGLTNIQIDHYLQDEPKFAGCFSLDQLPKRISMNHGYIINLDKSTGPGTHWVAVWTGKTNTIYFDSFGVGPATEIIKFMQTINKPMFFNSYQVQNIDSEACGFFCMFFLEHMFVFDNFGEFTNHFTLDTVSNEHELENDFGELKLTKSGGGIFNKFKQKLKSAVSVIKDIPNKLINNLPIELHAYDYKDGKFQKYSALGPGTKTAEREQRYRDTGDINHLFINGLDQLGYMHDKTYEQKRDREGRKQADLDLINGTEGIYKNKDLNMTQRGNSYLVNKLFKAKRYLGVGINQRLGRPNNTVKGVGVKKTRKPRKQIKI